ncbi:hypothetical protein TcasGA2_TC008536 [Tribolium castaneum]|uniref:Uncharacterized protein n=1 Tax=Tribolium castaneum TaxID=7070 RepID=D7EI84_TRICA|nr:hypothetical protein TcasGA2_TC008536 [Tribolium castaneum]
MPFLVEMEPSSGRTFGGGTGVSRISHSRRSALGTAMPRVCDTFPQLPFVNHSTHETKNVDSARSEVYHERTTESKGVNSTPRRLQSAFDPV